MSRQRGQASVELVGAGLLLALAALALAQLVLVWQAAERAHRLADQLAVAVAEGRRPPAPTGPARVRIGRDAVTVTMPVTIVIGTGTFAVTATAATG